MDGLKIHIHEMRNNQNGALGSFTEPDITSANNRMDNRGVGLKEN